MINRNKPLELWGGVECTHVRIGDEVRDQLIDTGHSARLDDIDAMADLGIKAVRYPILWERVAPESPHELDFSWHDVRLERLREHGIRVIAGLVHHGSGPVYAGLHNDRFPDLLADYARKVAQRYPWIDAWTPVNEPLTTARISCLYGIWHPHLKDIDSTFRATVIQCLGIVRAMKAIRAINPAAELFVTEDIGKTFSTPELAYQAEHENERRWLSLDLLTGKVEPGHYFHGWVRNKAASGVELDELAAAEVVPDFIGFDHYLTSERFLDHRVGRHPGIAAGSNGRHDYVDVEARRVASLSAQLGHRPRLRETWERYGLPMVISEVHHGCSREEQVRWLNEVWQSAHKARADGIDVRAVTLWALFGMVDWRSMLTKRDGVYDVGAFDTRSGSLRPTLVAKAAKRLAGGDRLDYPWLDLPGWWRRPGRTYRRPSFDTLPRNLRSAIPLLITGGTGTLGQAFARIAGHRGLPFVLTTRDELDITSAESIAAAIERHRPWAVVNTAGFVRTWEADAQVEECFRVNAAGPELLARACRLHGIPLVTFSSDLVFDGQLGRSYVEPDEPAPACAYGRSKAEAEARLIETEANALIIRTSAFFGPWDRHNFLFDTIEKLRRGEQIEASDRTIVSPTYVPDLVQAALDLLLDEEKGIWHLTNQGAVSWHDLAREIADRQGLPARKIRDSGGRRADTSLTSDRGLLLRPLSQALDEYLVKAEALPTV